MIIEIFAEHPEYAKIPFMIIDEKKSGNCRSTRLLLRSDLHIGRCKNDGRCSDKGNHRKVLPKPCKKYRCNYIDVMKTNRLIHEKVLISFSMPAIRWTGFPGATRRLPKQGRQACFSFHRIFHLSLVPCNGAGILRERGSCRAAQRCLCEYQG